MKQSLLILAFMLGFGATACAQTPDSVQGSSEALADSVEASAQLSAAGVKLTMGAVAIPLGVAAGSVELTGESAGLIANELWTAANAPLVIDDEIIIAPDGPPQVPAEPEPAVKESEQ